MVCTYTYGMYTYGKYTYGMYTYGMYHSKSIRPVSTALQVYQLAILV